MKSKPFFATAGCLRLILLSLGLWLAGVGCTRQASENWDLTNIKGALPDLKFNLLTTGNQPMTATELRGKIVLLYFGYTHCPDVCPMTMGQLADAIKQLGPRAADIRIVFISVDPQRDTPDLVATYAKAFNSDAVGVTGTPGQIEALAKRYRVAYESENKDDGQSYLVMHSKAVYVFDREGKARLMISDSNETQEIVHDLGQLASE